MASKKQYFKSLAEIRNPEIKEVLAKNEFPEELPIEDVLQQSAQMSEVSTNRRDFLKLLGFSTAAVTLAACQAPVTKSIPYITKPDGIIPGIPNYYATTFYDGYDLAHVLVKTREGRPIKIDSNPEAKYFKTTNARAQASVLSLYDNNRVKGPQMKGADTTWEKLDKYVKEGLNKAVSSGKKVVVLTPSLPSPTTKKLIQEFSTKYNAQQVIFDNHSTSNALDAAQEVLGQRVFPVFDLGTTELIVSFNADFLNDWNGINLEESFAKAKTPGANMLKTIQVEGNMSMTGAVADERMPLKPSASLKLMAGVYNALSGGSANAEAQNLASQLKAKGSKAVVLADGNKEAYVLMFAINQLLGSEAMSKDKAILTKESNDAVFNQFINDAQNGTVGVLINFQTNPVYASSNPKVKSALSKIPHNISLSTNTNETTEISSAIAPVPHWLETWNDINPVTGVYSLVQPTIIKIFNTRQFQDSLLTWIGGTQTNNGGVVLTAAVPSYYDYLRQNWEATLLPKLGIDFNKALYNGYNETPETTSFSVSTATANAAAQKLSATKESDYEIQLYTKSNIGDGTQANNPWLQELPDAITRTSWDNFILINPKDLDKLGLKNKFNGRLQLDGSIAKLSVNGNSITAPVYAQPGQAEGCLGIALGYGQKNVGSVAETGTNAYPLFINSETLHTGAKIEDTGKMHEFALIQAQNTVIGRYELAREVPLDKYLNENPEEWNEALKMHTYAGELPIGKIDLWNEFDSSDGPHFNLSVDLNTCTGCGACVVACQAENNVPVVGKEEMRRSRDMYWLRIDRYYASEVPPGADTNHDGKLSQEEAIHDKYTEPCQYEYLTEPLIKNPDIIFQPVMCQHCNHAPCETVCPVAATSHGKQGQNQMAYNRCVGTRYCANNCPYKVRRFNWFNYALNEDKFPYNMSNDLGRMVLNPDVVVRTRGVMEKCSLCIQMTQATILTAKKEDRTVKDGEFQTACTKACGTGSLQFGDVNDVNAHIRKLKEDKRKYVLLEDVGTKPNVFYQFKVRNRKENNA